MAPMLRGHYNAALFLLLIAFLLNGAISLDVTEKPANQSSTSDTGYEAGKAVDGNINSITHTAPSDRNPWWILDLQGVHCLKKITIINRMDKFDFRLAGAVIRAGLNPDRVSNRVLGTVSTAEANAPFGQGEGVITITAVPVVTARYVSVDLPGSGKHNILHVGEVMVEEFIDEEAVAATAIELNPSASAQSSTFSNQVAALAVDRAFQYEISHCSQTDDLANQWWKIELGLQQCVGKIMLKSSDYLYISERERFQGAVVRAGLSSEPTDNTMCGHPVTQYQAVANNWMEFDCNPPDGRTARYVSVDITKQTRLTLCEVFVLPCNLQTGGAVELTLVTNPALLGSNGNSNATIGAYKSLKDTTAVVSFGRELTTGGTNTGLPTGSKELQSDQLGCQLRQIQLPEVGGLDRTGVFFCEATKPGKTATRIQTIILSTDESSVYVRPVQRTQTVNIRDSVRLEMRHANSPNTNYRWQHDGRDVTSWNDQLNVAIGHVAVTNAGVYSCFPSGEDQRLHGIMRLIVRECSTEKWGSSSCLNLCRRCYNGGVCNARTGSCICAPGFSGEHCEQVHGRNVFGQNAGHRCSNSGDQHNSACRGRLFCLSDPYGCSCAAGFTGLDCMQECQDGMYGADCEQTCHCAPGKTCNKDTGECPNGACANQYFGNNCQCLKAEPFPGEVISTSAKKRSLSFSWSEPICVSQQDGSITGYKYKLRAVISGSQTELNNQTTSKSVIIENLIPYVEYNFQVAAETSQDGTGQYSSSLTVRTAEAKPTVPLNVSITNVTEDSITVAWRKPDPPQGNITAYKVSWTPDGAQGGQDVGITTSHRIHSLQLSATYSVKVRAQTKIGLGTWSETVTATVVGVPGPLHNLCWTNRTTETVILDWDPPSQPKGPISGYVVKYRATERPYQPGFTPVEDFIERETEKAPFVEANLEPSTKYEFSISAKNWWYTGTPSTLEVYTRPPKDIKAPPKPKPYESETTDTTVTIGLTALTSDGKYIEAYIVGVKKVKSSRLSRRESSAFQQDVSTNDYITAEFKKDSIPQKFTVGDSLTYGQYFNAPLQTDSVYEIRVGSVSQGNETEALVVFSDPLTVTVAQPNHSAGLAVGMVFLVLAIATIVLAAIIFYRRKANRPKRTSDGGGSLMLSIDQLRKRRDDVPVMATSSNAYCDSEGGSSPPTPLGSPKLAPKPSQKQVFKQPPPVRSEALADYTKMKESMKESGFEADYKTIPDGQLHPWTVASKPENKHKNRFANVIAYDHSRVVLTPMEGDPHSDYINACYVDGYKEADKYIASQGPNKGSLNDIWRMVWQLNVDKIVMLTNSVENGKVKCLQYWPNTGSCTYADISVVIVDERVFLDHTIRLLKITQYDSDEDCRVVKQFHYTTWPDMKPPEYPAPLLNFIRVVNSEQNEGRTLIHCSAGVGRTGTYICLDSMLQQMSQEGQVDVLGFIYRMRQKRIMMVQTLEQYQFVFDALLAASLTGETTYKIGDFRRQLTAMKKVQGRSKETGIEKQFQALGKLRLGRRNERSRSGHLPENATRNRFPDFIPTDRSRPFLVTTSREDDNNYINATFLPGYRKKCRYITTQMPMPSTAADIWRLMYDQKATCIVMLNPLDEDDESMCRYWPENGPIELGPLVVELLQTKQYKGVIGRTFSLRHVRAKAEPARTVCQFQCQDWPADEEVPSSRQGILTLMDLTQQWHEEKSPIVVHCMNGFGRSAVYCTLMSAMEQFQEENVVDVFQAVLRLRAVNSSMMYSMDHYAMCYDILQVNLDSSTVYENL